MLGYHFVGVTLKNGEPVPPDGQWLVHAGRIEPCVSGLHMSERPFQALQYAPGSTICRVELDGDLASHGDPIDKWVGRRRRIIGRADATEMLRRFAADQALAVAHMWDMPTVVRDYLVTLDALMLVAAGDAASAASAAARTATGVAAGDAASHAADAARTATWAAAWAATRNAADAARASTRAATWAAAEPVRNAAAIAAWAAAWAAAGIEFDLRATKLFTKG